MAKEDRGFASMDRSKQRDIASKGGKAAHQKGTAHEWTSEEAREAGRRGGMASHRRKQEQQGSPDVTGGGDVPETDGPFVMMGTSAAAIPATPFDVHHAVAGLALLWAIDVEEARDAIYRNFKALIHQTSQ